MLLHSDASPHLNRSHLASSGTKSRNRGTLRLVPTPHPLNNEEPRNGLFDRNCVLWHGEYSIRLTDSAERRNEVGALIKRMYSWRGYDIGNTPMSPQNNTTLEAFSGQDLVGTLTLRFDSEDGLLADELYEEKISAFRTSDRKICELSKLAIDPEFSSKELLASLFNLAYIYARLIQKATDFFIEINPRHAAYYKRMLGFRELGGMRNCPRVNAPAVLLHLELDYVDGQVSSLAGSHQPRERSLYPYFLSKHDEKKVVNRIQNLNQARAFGLSALCS
ncbi:N-acyl amino acid synthase FeeM domain-containing protein [Nitrosospira multiformis]|uniref:N-acyl amino acid synthase FeeM catalytic core domain-containing protein n=1 Tax=Nitrosospira multiformis TaxID=1231 RepID=A0A1I7FH56_9PROT|nr:hypothetical protein SAMN05216417_101476 [Nitrosospira multiformis]